MIGYTTLATLLATVALVRGAPVPMGTGQGGAVTVDVDAASTAVLTTVSRKELCYLEFAVKTEIAHTRYAKDQLIKDTEGKDVVLNDGYKKDESGRETYYVSYCYASGSVKGSTSESKKGESTTNANPFAQVIDGLDIKSNAGFGGSSGLLASLVSGGGLLKKRQMLDGLGGLGGSPLDGSFGSPLSSFGSSPLDALSSPLGSSPLGGTSPLGGSSSFGGFSPQSGGIVNPANNFKPSSAIQNIGSSDDLASQRGLIGDRGRNFGNLGDGRSGGFFQEDASIPSSTVASAPVRPSAYHVRQSSVDEDVIHSDSRQTTAASPNRRTAARTTSLSASRSSFVPVELAQPDGPTIAVAAVSQATPASEAPEYSIQTIAPTSAVA
ncbi:hypothetical protein JCM3770_003181 [Rhodotorula araucariae]